MNKKIVINIYRIRWYNSSISSNIFLLKTSKQPSKDTFFLYCIYCWKCSGSIGLCRHCIYCYFLVKLQAQKRQTIVYAKQTVFVFSSHGIGLHISNCIWMHNFSVVIHYNEENQQVTNWQTWLNQLKTINSNIDLHNLLVNSSIHPCHCLQSSNSKKLQF